MDEKLNTYGKRPRAKYVKVFVSPDELCELSARADQCGLSLSGYLRAAGLNHPIHSVYDLRAVADLAKVNGDLGRVAGLLKLWLADWRGFGAKPAEVEKMMERFREIQSEVSVLMQHALK